jgi:uncharacterized membrane protein YoaK (UPF0700 family)
MTQAVLLALIAGYADTVGYLRFKAFAGLMTGNTIFLGIELAEQKWILAGYHASIIGVFLFGVILAQALLRFRTPVWAALCIAAGLLAVCGLLDHRAASLVLAMAMGLQNSAANRFNGVALNTVFVTGNIQKVGEGLAAWLWPARDAKGSKGVEFAIYGWVWMTYAVGAGLGAIAEQTMSQPLLLPAALLPMIMAPWPDLWCRKA